MASQSKKKQSMCKKGKRGEEGKMPLGSPRVMSRIMHLQGVMFI
jgi:hypothetical protein